MRGRIGTMTRRTAIVAGGALAGTIAAPFGIALGATAGASPDIDSLVARMTPEEKAGQLTLMASALGGGAATALNPKTAGTTSAQQLDDARAGRLGGVFNGRGADWHRQLQQAAMQSRLKIPMLFAADVIHGFRTVFPVPLAEAASFEPELARRTARAAATEAAAAGIDWTFAPMVDVARDARWGRGVEGSGEDVLLGRRFAAARVRGFQGDDLAADDAVMACPKHFAAYGAAEGGLDYNTVDISERTLREVYFPPFRAGFDAGAGTTMAAFNEIAGVPVTANRWLLTDVLRGEWGFEGLVVSDYTADMELIAHGFAEDARDAARLAFLAGVDMSMESGLYRRYLPDLVKSGAVPMARLDEAVRRVLALKARLGLFADPFRRLVPGREAVRVRTPETLALAREAARRSVVMLKNDAGVLPLRPDRRIALIGPFAEGLHDLIGPWNVYGDDAQAIDLATGIRRQMTGGALTVVAGSGVEASLPGGIEAAVAAARAADVTILAIGEPAGYSGEAQSRTAIVVPAAQQAMVTAVAATGTPVVIVLKNGRALALEGAVLAAPAILVSWFLGSETGPALADILFGVEGPSGRLPVSFPYESGQEPLHYDHKPTGRPNPPGPAVEYKAHYRTAPDAARFPFGHGLTYGAIDYAGLDLGTGALSADAPLEIAATIGNRGARAAEEVVQLYIRDRAASVTRPVRELKDFTKIALAPGESKRVRFTLTRDQLLFIGQAMKPTVEPGLFDLWIAPSAQAEGVTGRFRLIA